jgi:16S rRNA (cytidine1402-2'-O)-methyltransferase
MAGKHGAAGRGRLYVVATPIGNLGDISGRAVATFAAVHVVFAEDTRHTRGLLAHHGIRTKLAALHEHNEREAARALLEHLEQGRDVALVTDAGTPLMSDPGVLLVAAAARAGRDVVAVPGPCAAVAALSVAGLPTDRFAFEGFLPAKAVARRKALGSLAREARTLVFYEAPHRLVETLADLATAFGETRAASVGRELTKRFECTYRGTLGELAARSREDADMTRGELVIVVGGAPALDEDARRGASALRVLQALLQELPVSQAARLAAQITGARRKDLYERALALAPPQSAEE